MDLIKDDLVPAELVRRGDILRSLKSFETDVTTTADYRAGIRTAIWVASVIEGVGAIEVAGNDELLDEIQALQEENNRLRAEIDRLSDPYRGHGLSSR